MASCREPYCDAAHKENMYDFAFEEMFVRSDAGRL
jgi:CDGSH-type Zn-finger protein